MVDCILGFGDLYAAFVFLLVFGTGLVLETMKTKSVMMPDRFFMDAYGSVSHPPVLESGCRYLKSFFLLQAVAASSD